MTLCCAWCGNRNRESWWVYLNFHDYERIAWIDETDGMYQDMMTGEMLRASAVRVDGHGFRWLKEQRQGADWKKAPCFISVVF